MDNEQIIIDSVDVSGCPHYKTGDCFISPVWCNQFYNCEYKQLARKEQELEPFKDDYFKNLDTKTIAELAKKSIRLTAEYRKLENILRDIKEICLQQNLKADFTACKILDIINKVKEQ